MGEARDLYDRGAAEVLGPDSSSEIASVPVLFISRVVGSETENAMLWVQSFS